MVTQTAKATAIRRAKSPPVALRRYSSVRASEVFRTGLRLEASAYSIEGRLATQAVITSGLRAVPLAGDEGLCHDAYNAFRFRRVYVEPGHGLPLLSSSDIIRMDIPDYGYVSRKATAGLDSILIRTGDVLVSCSGTIGNVALAGAVLDGKALTQHAIRLRLTNPETAGYITAFLRSRFGRPQLTRASYGAVISHIEPKHLEDVLIPDPSALLLTQIGRPMVEATRHRDEANQLIEDAQNRLLGKLGLKPIEQLQRQAKKTRSWSVRASGLSDRFDASYHGVLARLAERQLAKSGVILAPLSDSRLTAEIRPITKFRTRVYVDHGGIPFLSSKELFQVDPIGVKRLAKGAHTKDMAEIELAENMVAVTRSGTIGKVQIIPAYMAGWAGSEHAIRVIAVAPAEAGYLFAWLSSGYGGTLITRYQYGAVILEIDKGMLGSVPIPVLSTAERRAIGEMVLEANRLRDAAWGLEQDAIGKIEHIIEGRGASLLTPIERDFHHFANEWQAETRHLSSAEQIAGHPAYRSILGMGAAAVPLILGELSHRPAFWFRALNELTGQNPVGESIRGNVERMAEAWIRWGRGRGYKV